MKPTFMDLKPEEYHADYSAISKSMLWRFRDRRQAYRAEFVDCVRAPKEPSDAMKMGTLAHAGCLHPESLDKLYAVYPESVLGKNGTRGTGAAREFEEAAAKQGKIVLKAEQMELVRGMVASVKAKLEPWLKVNSIRERPVYWENPQTGLLCRCMADWLIEKQDVVFAFDLKTTSSAHPDEFVRKVEDYGYWLQQSHYCEGIEALFGKPCQFRFVVVESDFPHTCCVQAMQTDLQIQESKERRIALLRDLKHCLVTGNWSEPWERDIAPIVLRPGGFDRAA